MIIGHLVRSSEQSLIFPDRDRRSKKLQDHEPAAPTGITTSPAEPEVMDASGDNDEILDAVVKTVTTPAGHAPRDNRRRSRNTTRKSRKLLCCIPVTGDHNHIGFSWLL
jgi:hypothetical protein